MTFIYCLEECPNYLKFTVKGGPSTLQDMFTYVDYMVEKSRTTNTNRVLVDETLAKIKLDFHKAVTNGGMPRHDFFEGREMRVAVLCSPHSLDLYNFFENSNNSQYFQLRFFDDKENALEWLEVS